MWQQIPCQPPPPVLVYNSTKTAVTVTADFSSASLKASNYESSVVTITAAGRTKALNIEGNAKANKIVGTSGGDTISGGAGNDTLTGGDGADVFIFDGKGTDVITDYAAGEDILKLSGTVGTYSISGSDATFKVGSGTVKVTGGKNKAVTVVDSKNATKTYDGGLIYDGTIAKAKVVTVSDSYGTTLASYGASVVTIDASARTKALNITGNAAANKITGTSANDTINGGAGNDTLYGGKGKNLFIYESGGGNDVVADYTAGQDTIKIVGDSVSAYSLSSGDAVLKIGSGSIKVKSIKTGAITVVDANKNVTTYQSGAIYNAASAAKATAITLTSAYGNSFTAGSSAISVDASPRTAAINITGSAKNNYLVGGAGKDIIDGGKGNDTLRGGKGADVLTGGSGSDVFVYAEGDGTDAITDYVSGEDIIKLTSGEVKSYSVKNNDAIFKIGSGAITLKGAGLSAVSVLDADDVLTVYNGGLIYNNTKIAKADAVTITSDYEGEFNSYGASVETIDAAARSKAIDITGNGADNYILGGKGKDTINGGKGSDTIFGGKGNDLLTGGNGNDVFYFSGADGNDTITDYTAGKDIISVEGAVSYSTKNSDAILKIGTGNVTLQNAADVAITLVGADSVASIYSGKNVSTKKWAGFSGGTGVETVTVTETVEVEVTLPAETVTVAGETVTETVEVEVTLPAETITVGGGETVTVTVYGSDTVEPNVDWDGETVTLESTFSGTFSLPAYNATVTVDAVNVDGSLVRNSLVIYGDDEANILRSAMGATTIYAGNGNDVICCGRAVDMIYYYSDGGGNDTVYDYKTGDVILQRRRDQFDDTTFQNVSLSGNDIIINYTSGEKITLKDAKDQRISLSGYRYEYDYPSYQFYSYYNTFGRVSISGSSVTLNSDYLGDFQTWQYGIDFTNINGVAVTNTVTIRGNDSGNTIYGGKGGSTIYSGNGNDFISGGNGNSYINAGNGNNIVYASDNGYSIIYTGEGKDTIYCGNGGGTIYAGDNDDVIYCDRGDDLIYYYSDGGGNDTIYDYKTGDIILQRRRDQFDDTTFKNVSLSGNDIIINYTSGEKITLKDAKDQRISLSGYRYEYDYPSYQFYSYYNTFGRVSISDSSVTLNGDYQGDSFRASHYAASLTNINAASISNAINLYGNDSANVIYAGKDGGSIYAGGGNDTIYCNNGKDSIMFYDGGGNDIIYNIGNNDAINLFNCTAESVSVSGNDIIIKTDGNETLILKNGTGKNISITGKGTQTYTANNGNAAVPWFIEDDTNFTTGADLDELIDKPIANSAGALSVGGGDSLGAFACDFAFAHTDDK